MTRWTILPILVLAAETVAAAPLTLTEAVDLALRGNPEAAAAAELRRAGELETSLAGGAFWPTISFRSSVTRVDRDTWATANSALLALQPYLPSGVAIEPFLYRDTYRTEFTLQQPIWLGGALRAGRAGARARAAGARAEHERTRAAVILRAKAAFYRRWEAEELLRVAEASAAAARARRDEMADRHAVGEIDRSVALRWAVFLSEQELALAAAEGAVATAGAELNAALGRDALAPVAVAPPDPAEDPATALAGLDESGYLARVRSLSPDLAAARAAGREAEAGVTAARAGWLPALTAAGSYGWKQDDDLALDGYQSWSAGLALSYPLFDGLRNLARHRQASARARAAAHAVQAARQALEREAARLFHEHATARRQRTAARAAHEQAEAHLAIVADRFRLGLVSNVTLVDAQTARDRAAAGVVSAEVRVVLALAAMERLLGPVAAAPESATPAPRSRP